MAGTTVHFERPPVVETVLGVHFKPIPGLTAAHAGIFWREVLGTDWPKAVDAPLLADQTEKFEGGLSWLGPGSVFQLALPHLSGSRLQVSSSAGDRMVQIQPNRFHYNWKSTGEDYPSYSKVRREFDHYFGQLARFVEDEGLGKISPFQWEVTYVDYVQPGELWHSLEDWHRVIPGLLGEAPRREGLGLETVSGEWRYEIAPKRGRLYINLALGKTAEKDTTGLLIQWTARGPVVGDTWDELGQGLDLGHDVLLRKFLDVTSPEAHKAWGRKE
jgi:uncharacterized protein (TIGR04255 family)